MLINHDAIILTKAEKGLNLRKVASLVNILFFWGLTLYIMRSLFVVSGWLIMYMIFGDAFSYDGFEGMVHTILFWYLPLIVLATVVLWSWAGYNRMRFGGFRDKRRVHPDPLTMREISDYTNLPMEKLAEMRDSKILVCHFDEFCELQDVVCLNPPEEAPDVEIGDDWRRPPLDLDLRPDWAVEVTE